jgi:hypothetical protein
MSLGPHSKTPAQRDRILALLRQRGTAGVTNVELNALGIMRFGARVFELRRQGFNVETRRESETIFRFVLLAESPHPPPANRRVPGGPPHPPGLSSYGERARVLHAEAMPLFAGVQP